MARDDAVVSWLAAQVRILTKRSQLMETQLTETMSAVYDAIGRNHDGNISRAEFAAAMGQGQSVQKAATSPATGVSAGFGLGQMNVSAAAPTANVAPMYALPPQVAGAATYASAPTFELSDKNEQWVFPVSAAAAPTATAAVMTADATPSNAAQAQPTAATSYAVQSQAAYVTAPSYAAQTLPTNAVHPQAHAAPQAHAEGPTQKLQVSIVQATGLKHSNFTGDNMFCVCEVHHADEKSKAAKCETKRVVKSLEPLWNETHELEPWRKGEPLEFTVYDHGMIGSKTEGKAHLPSEYFYPNGFEGVVPIEGMAEAMLHVRVLLAGLSLADRARAGTQVEYPQHSNVRAEATTAARSATPGSEPAHEPAESQAHAAPLCANCSDGETLQALNSDGEDLDCVYPYWAELSQGERASTDEWEGIGDLSCVELHERVALGLSNWLPDWSRTSIASAALRWLQESWSRGEKGTLRRLYALRFNNEASVMLEEYIDESVKSLAELLCDGNGV